MSDSLSALLEGLKDHAAKAPAFVALIDDSFEKQAAFVRDPARLKAALCTRRAGKSNGAAIWLTEGALEAPNAESVYVALTKDSALAIIIPVFRELNEKHRLGLDIKEGKGNIHFPNGHVIRILGLDADKKLMLRMLGRKLKRVVIDEGASWTSDMRKLVYEIFKPALADLRGEMAMIGTPGDVAFGLFYDITTGKEPGWSLHEWDTSDNPYMRMQWAEEIADLKKNHPDLETLPWYQRMYRKMWVADDNKLVYRFKPASNFYRREDLPKDWRSEMIHILGIDLGFSPDPTAFVVVSFFREGPKNLYLTFTHVEAKMDFEDVAKYVKALQAEFTFEAIVIDGANKQGVETMRNRHRIPFENAEKTDKQTFIGLLNSDLSQGFIKVPEVGADALLKEWANLIWKVTSPGKKKEDPQCANHLSDAFLYAWRKTRHYLAAAVVVRPKTGTPEHYALKEQELEEQAERAFRISKGLEDEPDDDLDGPDWD